MGRSAIEWTEATWNPMTGCDKVSPGCKHCYAEIMARRLQAMGQPNYRAGFRLTPQEHMLEIQRQCRTAGVPFFFKQWGGFNKKRAGRLLQGRTWDEMPLLSGAQGSDSLV